MKKDFDIWNTKKIRINDIDVVALPFFHEREVWFVSLGANVGYEQDGTGPVFQRPIVIVRKFNNEIFWGIPLSKTEKRGQYYFPFSFVPGVESVALLSQIRLIDGRRLGRKVGVMGEADFLRLIQKLKALLP